MSEPQELSPRDVANRVLELLAEGNRGESERFCRSVVDKIGTSEPKIDASPKPDLGPRCDRFPQEGPARGWPAVLGLIYVAALVLGLVFPCAREVKPGAEPARSQR